jgi:hypothetical protein
VLVSFWKPNLTLNMVHDFTVYPRGGIPPQMEERASCLLNYHRAQPPIDF